MWSYRPHLEERDPIWGDDWLHSPFIRRSPSWGFLGFSSALRQMPGDLCTAPRIISLSTLSLGTDVTDATLGASGLWLGTWTRSWWHRHNNWKFFFGRSPWLHEQQEETPLVYGQHSSGAFSEHNTGQNMYKRPWNVQSIHNFPLGKYSTGIEPVASWLVSNDRITEPSGRTAWMTLRVTVCTLLGNCVYCLAL